MGYEYRKIPYTHDKEYLDTIDKIENMKDRLKINQNKLYQIMNNDIFHSLKIEGNSLTRTEITYILENDITIRGKSLKDHIQVKNYDIALKSLKQILLKIHT